MLFRSAQERIEVVLELLQQAAQEPDVVSQLHAINDRLQRGLIDVTNELGQRFFGLEPPEAKAPPPPAPASQSQTQSQSQSST